MPAAQIALALLLLAPLAHAQPFGSPLTVAPNISVDCSVKPVIVDPNGTFGGAPSGTADCSWRQSGVFGVVSGDPRFSSVPATGTITSMTVRSGPNPAPLRAVLFRQLGTGPGGRCCFYIGETQPFRLTAGATQTVPLNIPVIRDRIEGLDAVDLIGISAASGAGTLPLFSTGRNNAFDLTTPGSVNAGFFYPRLGTIPNDTGGGRPEEGIPGIELTVQWGFVPATVGGGGPAGAALRAQNAAFAARRALIDLACNGNAACRGLLEVLNPIGQGAITNASRAKGGRFGMRRYEIAPGGNLVVPVKLNAKARRLLRVNGALATTVRLTPDGGAPTTANLLITKG
jgi:hypothetical protein